MQATSQGLTGIAAKGNGMDEIGLYYPYFHVRDDMWLKAAALYLPRLARVRPPEYPVRDSPTAAVLRDELDFLLDVDPGAQAQVVAREFEALVDREEGALRERYRLSEFDPSRRPGVGAEVRDPALLDDTRCAWIHKSQLGHPVGTDRFGWDPIGLVDRLCRLRLAVTTRFDPLTGVRDDNRWVGMHPRLVAVYSCALADRIARANTLSPVTNDPSLFALPGKWTVEELGAVLLEGPRPAAPRGSGEISAMYAYAALQAVVPADLQHVPVEKIVQARRTLSDEFQAFRSHLDALSEEFVRLDGIEDPGILQSRLESMVERDLTRPARELERGLRALGMRPARAVLGLKSLELPAVAALAAHALGLSSIAGAGGMVAVQLLASVHRARRTSREQRNSAPGYLLGLRQELEPIGVLARARHMLTGTV